MTDAASATNRSSRFFSTRSSESAIHSWVMGVHAEADSILASNGTMRALPPTTPVTTVVAPSAVPPPVPPKDDPPPAFTIVDANNNSIPTNPRAKKGRPGSILSISSEDSINLEDLIEHNTSINLDSDGEMPDLGDLELDDSKDDFWKLELDGGLEKFFPITNATSSVTSGVTPILIRPAATSSTPPVPKAAPSRTSRKSKYNKARVGGGGDSDNSLEDFDNVDVERLWETDTMEKNPEEDEFDMSLDLSRDGKALSSPSHSSVPGAQRNTSIYSRLPHSPSNLQRRPRSGSQSSENSNTSQSTIIGNSHLPRAFSPTFPAESTSASSGGRSHSRLSNYSNGSQTSSTSGLQRPRTISTNSSASNNGSSLQAPNSGMGSRLRSPHASQTPNNLTKRSSHIPNPNPAAHIISPIPSPTTSNASSSTAEYPQRSLSRVSNSSYSSQGTSPVSRRISALPRPGTPTGPTGSRISAAGMTSTSRMSMYSSTPSRPRTGSNASSTGTPAYASPSSRGSITPSSTPPARTSSITTSAAAANRTSRVPPPRAMSPAPGLQRANTTASELASRVASPLANRSGTPTNGLRMSRIGMPAFGRGRTGT